MMACRVYIQVRRTGKNASIEEGRHGGAICIGKAEAYRQSGGIKILSLEIYY